MTKNSSQNDPEHDLALTDVSGNIIKMMLVDTLGRKDPRALQVGQVEPTAMKFSQGQGSYDDMTPPWMVAVQEDWSGGRGSKEFEKDRSRFSDSYRMNTWREGSLMLAPLEKWCTGGYKNNYQKMLAGGDIEQLEYGGSHGSTDLTGLNEYLACLFTATAGATIEEIWILVRIHGLATGIQAKIYSNSAGPDAVITNGTATLDGIGPQGSGSAANGEWGWMKFEFAIDPTLVDTDVYHLVLTHSASDADNYYEICTYQAISGGGGTHSSDGSNWTSTKSTMFFRIEETQTNSDDYRWVFLEYKGAFYAYSRPPTGNSYLYICGDRGVADSNTGNLGKLIDGAKSWSSLGSTAIVTILSGPGSEEEVPWRRISSNTGTEITVASEWLVEHTTDTHYAIVNSDDWTSLLDLGGYVTDYFVTNEYIYFARGETAGDDILRYEWYNNGGVATTRSAPEGVSGRYLLSIRHPDEELETLYISKNDHDPHGSTIGKMQVPGTWNDLFFPIKQLADTDTPWGDRNITNCTQATDKQSTKIAVASGFATGICAVQNLAQPVDMTRANKIGFWIKSSVDVNSGDLEFTYDDFDDNGADASKLIKQVTPLLILDGSENVNQKKWYDSDIETVLYSVFTSAKYFHIMSSFEFNGAYFRSSDFNDTEVVALTGEYFDGYQWTALSNFVDGTDISGKTMAQNGWVTFDTPENWALWTMDDIDSDEQTGYAIRLNAELNSYNPEIEEVYIGRFNAVKLDIPALVADEWQYVILDISPSSTLDPDDSSIRSVGINVEVDNGAQNIWIKDGIQLLYDEPDWKPVSGKITGVEMYRPNDSDPQTNPIVFTETLPYEMQAQNDDSLVPFRIGELKAFKSEKTGRVHCVNGPYLYFTVGEEKLERYYNNNLDDIGPDTDEGLPEGRRGSIDALLSFPGHVFAAVSSAAGEASILRLKGSSWHEIYRAPYDGLKITDLYHQTIPGSGTGKLWFDLGGDILYIYVVSGNPREAGTYMFTNEGALVSGHIYGGMKDIHKVWKSLKIFNENASGSYYIEADYKVDTDTSWTEIDGAFDVEPSKELEFDSSYPTARRLQYRARVYSKNTSDSPDIGALIVDLFGVVEVHSSISFNTILEDDYVSRNIRGKPEKPWGEYTSVETAMIQAEAWRDAGTALTLGCKDTLPDGKQVAINQIVYYRAGVEKEQVPSGAERWVVQFLCHEI